MYGLACSYSCNCRLMPTAPAAQAYYGPPQPQPWQPNWQPLPPQGWQMPMVSEQPTGYAPPPVCAPAPPPGSTFSPYAIPPMTATPWPPPPYAGAVAPVSPVVGDGLFAVLDQQKSEIIVRPTAGASKDFCALVVRLFREGKVSFVSPQQAPVSVPADTKKTPSK
jgi:hypothetical protein